MTAATYLPDILILFFNFPALSTYIDEYRYMIIAVCALKLKYTSKHRILANFYISPNLIILNAQN